MDRHIHQSHPDIAKRLKRAEGHNLIASLRSARRSDGFWLGLIWTGAGFLGSNLIPKLLERG